MTFFGSRFSTGTAFFLFAGDIEFAIDAFKKRVPFMLGPILYAGGQFLIALASWF